MLARGSKRIVSEALRSAGGFVNEGPSPPDLEVYSQMLKSISVVAAVAAALSFATVAYAGQKGPQTEEDNAPPKPLPPLQKNFPLDQTWSLRELNGKPVPPGIDISLKIDGTLRGSGYDGCNSWSATMYPIKDQHLAVGPYALTKKQCPNKDLKALEIGFLSALLGNPAWDLVNDDLVIKGPRGSMRLVRSL
jgi:heat shock protein HslJ